MCRSMRAAFLPGKRVSKRMSSVQCKANSGWHPLPAQEALTTSNSANRLLTKVHVPQTRSRSQNRGNRLQNANSALPRVTLHLDRAVQVPKLLVPLRGCVDNFCQHDIRCSFSPRKASDFVQTTGS